MRKGGWIGLGVGALATGVAGGAAGNDSSAELAAGGLVLTKNAAIQMQSEDLSISPKQVRVHYVFRNTSAKDVTLTVAFPMPDVTMDGVDSMISIPEQAPANFLGFSTTVDGRPVAAQVEQRVVKNGVDRTALLTSLGVPLAPYLQATDDALDKLPQAAKDQLVKLELAVPNDYDVGHGVEHHLGAAWTLRTKYYWTQTFPAGKTLVEDHVYQPSVGETAGTTWGSAYAPKEAGYAAKRAHYCVDDAFIAGARKAIPAGQDFAALYEQRIEYVLSSGANWAAPIGDFRMTVDKGAPENLISFCGTGVAKISPTAFQVHYANFRPTGDVSILILLPHKE